MKWKSVAWSLIWLASAACVSASNGYGNTLAHASCYNLADFGARGDGVTLASPTLNRLLALCSSRGGGTIVVPAGRWLCGSIRLRSNVTVELESGAVIIAAAPNLQGKPIYDAAEPNAWARFQDFGHSHWHNSLMWGENLHDVSVVGPGRFWGRGLSRGTDSGLQAEVRGVANKVLALKNCHNVHLAGFSVLHGGHFGILASGVDNLDVERLTIDTNRDGIDIDCCRNVHVRDCTVNSPWDDAIVLKTSFALGSARPTEDVTISGCTVCGGWREGTLLDGTFQRVAPSDGAYRTGRIKLGTESTGTFRNIGVANCTFESSHGLSIESVDGATIEDVAVTNLIMHDVTTAPIFLRLGSRMRAPQGTTVGAMRRVVIDNVTASTRLSDAPILIAGIPGHPIEDVSVSHIRLVHLGHRGRPVEPGEKIGAYPEPTMFGDLPAQALYVRHARNFDADDISVLSSEADNRPGCVLSDVDGATLHNVAVPTASRLLDLHDVTRLLNL